MEKESLLSELEGLIRSCLDCGVRRPINSGRYKDGTPRWRDVFDAGNAGYMDALKDVFAAIHGDTSLLERAKASSKSFDDYRLVLARSRATDSVPEKEIAASELVKDIRSGKSHADLIQKYGFSMLELQSAFDELLMVNALFPEDLPAREPPEWQAVEKRREGRGYLNFALTVLEAGDPRKQGMVRDITERGIAITGIEAQVGEIRDLRILSDALLGFRAIEFEARCRWGKREAGGGQYIAGFEITAIAESSLIELQRFIEALTVKTDAQDCIDLSGGMGPSYK